MDQNNISHEKEFVKKIANIIFNKDIIKKADLCDIRIINDDTIYIRFMLIVNTEETRLKISSKLDEEFINEINHNKGKNNIIYKNYDIDFDIEYEDQILNIKN